MRKESYVEKMEERDPENKFLYRWAGPGKDNKRTSKQCKRVLEMIEDRGGAVTLPEMKEIMEKAVNDLIIEKELHPSARRTVSVKSLQPHINCRHRMIRVK
jgi:hypothetical protein